MPMGGLRGETLTSWRRKRKRLRRQSLTRARKAERSIDVKRALFVRCQGRCENPRCTRLVNDPHHHPKRWQQAGVVTLYAGDGRPLLFGLCRLCHDRTDAPYALGRLLVYGEPGHVGVFAFAYGTKAAPVLEWTERVQW